MRLARRARAVRPFAGHCEVAMSLALKLSLGFLIGGASMFGQSVVSCSSDDMRRHYCSVDTSGGVSLVRQRSDASCIEGRTWGYDRRGIWVDRGCRAEFALNSYRGNGGYGGYGRNRDYGYGGNYPPNGGRDSGYGNYSSTMRCDSDDMRRHWCSVDTRGGVQLLRQRSDAACIEGRTWGYDRRGIWVDRGCRAEFAVGTGNYRNDRGRNNSRNRDPYYRDRNSRWPW
jgi:hypothetical protein